LINFLYCFDKNYNTQAFVSIYSLLKNVSKEINIHIIHNQPETLNNIPKKILDHNNLSELYINKFENKNFSFPKIDGAHVSEATYYRFFIEDFISSEIKNLVYLDSDIVCINDPILETEKTIKDLENSNYFVSVKPEPQSANKELDIKSDRYFNAGVMIIKTDEWLKNNLKTVLLEKAEHHKEKIQFWDQDILNLYFNGEYIDLSKFMNFSLNMVPFEKSTKLNSDELTKIKLIHYAGKFKPWSLKGIVNYKSEFYQETYRELFNQKYHLQSSWKINTIRDLIKSFKTRTFFKVKHPINLLLYVFLSLIKRKEV